MNLASIAVSIAWPPLWASWWMWYGRRQPAWWRVPLALASAAIGDGIAAARQGIWVSAGISAGYLIAAIMLWFRRRRKRRPATALIGAKSKAARDALVQAMREGAAPRHALRPVPGGAR